MVHPQAPSPHLIRWHNMTYTFDPGLSSDASLVRFHIGDTNPDGHYLEDETINYFLNHGGVAVAVVRCIGYIITQLSTPNFSKDWLTVSNDQARAGYENLLKQKALELGVSLTNVTAASTISLPYNADSYQDSSTSVYDGTP
jgi:hypothetical protein